MNNYLNDLKDYLEDKDISKNQIKEIISDYKEFYEDYSNSGLTHEEIILKLGTPKEVYRSLKGTLTVIKTPSFGSKLIAVSPFLSVITYILLGYYLEAWHPGWVVFLSIPLFGVMFNKKNILAVITESLIFIGIIISTLLPYYDVLPWKYSWLFIISFLMPSVFAYNKQSLTKAVMMEISIIIAFVLYIVLVAQNVSVPVSLLSFILPFIVGIYLGHIEVTVNFSYKKGTKHIILITIFLISTSLFIIFGLIYNNWAYLWQILLIPFMAAIILERKDNDYTFTPLMPFLATIIFYSLGYFYDAWAVSWLAYLLIPLVGILEGKPIVEVTENVEN